MLSEETAHGVEHAAHGGGGDGGTGQVLIEHVTDSDVWHLFKDIHVPLPEIELFGLDFSISLHVVMMWVSAALLLGIFGGMARSMQRSEKNVPRGGFALLELLVEFVRDEIAFTTMGKQLGRKMTPLMLTFFFFILFCNLLGLIPFMATATGNINVTAALAVLAFVVVQAQGVMHNGFIGYVKSFIPSGVPVFLIPIIFPIEVMGQFTRHFALCMRLFANMIAGHVVILALFVLIITLGTVLVSPVSVGLSLFVYLLEILVAFIQAYIFTMLAGLFIGMAAHPDH